MQIHPTAIIDPTAIIHPSVRIGAFCIIGKNVHIGANTVLHSHVIIAKNTKIGERNEIFQFASIGADCQDLKYQGEETWLEIGDDNTIREACSIHRGTTQDNAFTKIGNRNLFMVNTHIAHDCVVGDDNIIANNVGVAGHVSIGNHVIIGGNSGIHQFCKIDDYSMIGGASLIIKDVASFTMVSGNPAKSHGINVEGMKRKNWSDKTINTLKEAYKIAFRSGLLKNQVLERLSILAQKEAKVQLLINSFHQSKRGLIR